MKQAMTSHPDWETVWAAARERLRRELGDAVFDAWIAPLVLAGFENGGINPADPKPFHQKWINKQYVTRIERALRLEGGEPSSLTIGVVAPTIGVRAPKDAASEPESAS